MPAPPWREIVTVTARFYEIQPSPEWVERVVAGAVTESERNAGLDYLEREFRAYDSAKDGL